MSDPNPKQNSPVVSPNASEPAIVPKPSSLQGSPAKRVPKYYQLLIKLIKPLYRLVLWRRHQKAKQQNLPIADYKQEIQVRFGKDYPPPPIMPVEAIKKPTNHQETYRAIIGGNPTVWCHAVSLGETNTIAPMLDVMLQKGAKIWLTNTTQTGFARAEKLFAKAIQTQQLVHTFVPTDDKKIIQKFLRHVKPDLAMFVETELWANVLAQLAAFDIPSVLVNGRLSQKSFERYHKFSAVSSSMMQNITMIIAQDTESAKRFRQLGASAAKIRRADSLKWSSHSIVNSQTSNKAHCKHKAHDDTAFINSFIGDKSILSRPIWVAGSTHEGEEHIILQAHQKLLATKNLQDSLLIIVPRHPERFDNVASKIYESSLNTARRSLNDKVDATTQVYLADSMGELEQFYQVATVCFVGGSLVDIGGHNPIEASVYAKPVIMGRYTQSCQALVDDLHAAGALQIVDAATDALSQPTTNQNITTAVDALYTILCDWLQHTNKAEAAGCRGKVLVHKKSHALQAQLAMVEQLFTLEATTSVPRF